MATDETPVLPPLPETVQRMIALLADMPEGFSFDTPRLLVAACHAGMLAGAEPHVQELRRIDMMLARRDALEGLTRCDQISKLLFTVQELQVQANTLANENRRAAGTIQELQGRIANAIV